MRVFLLLFGKELRTYFHSLIAYVVLGLSMLLHGLTFVYFVYALRKAPAGFSLVEAAFNSDPFWRVLILIVPVITMRLFSEEQKSGTLEPLLTAPVRTSQLVLAKFASALVFFLILYLPVILNFAIYERISGSSAAFSPASYCGAFTMVFLAGALFLSVGCLASALTSNQIVAAVTCFSVLAVIFFLGFVSYVGYELNPLTVQVLSYLSPREHMRDFCRGLFDTRPFVYYLSTAALMLYLTHQALEYRKWKV